MTTCPTCRHVHAGVELGYVCIGCGCPHVGTCQCSHCRTRAVLDDTEVMAALQARFDEVTATRKAKPLSEHDPETCPGCIDNRRRIAALRSDAASEDAVTEDEWTTYLAAIRSYRGASGEPTHGC